VHVESIFYKREFTVPSTPLKTYGILTLVSIKELWTEARTTLYPAATDISTTPQAGNAVVHLNNGFNFYDNPEIEPEKTVA
jgi:hypothetical protein